MKEGVRIVARNNHNNNNLEYEVDPYRYENPNDSLYCSQKTVSILFLYLFQIKNLFCFLLYYAPFYRAIYNH